MASLQLWSLSSFSSWTLSSASFDAKQTFSLAEKRGWQRRWVLVTTVPWAALSPEEELTWPSFGIIITYSRSKMPRAKSRGRKASCHLLKPLSLPSAYLPYPHGPLEVWEGQMLLSPFTSEEIGLSYGRARVVQIFELSYGRPRIGARVCCKTAFCPWHHAFWFLFHWGFI